MPSPERVLGGAPPAKPMKVLPMLGGAGRDGTEVAKELARLLPLKTKAAYEADAIAKSDAKRAVERASRCVVVARRAIQD